MSFGWRAGAALCAVSLGGGVGAATPPLIWQDVTGVRVQCLVAAESGADQGELSRRICTHVRDLASAGAPVPVSTIQLGDPAVLAQGTVTLLVHGLVQRSAGGDTLAFSIRPFRNSAEASILFAAPPRAVALSGGDSTLEAALGASLRDTLPWLARPAGPRPLNQ